MGTLGIQVGLFLSMLISFSSVAKDLTDNLGEMFVLLCFLHPVLIVIILMNIYIREEIFKMVQILNVLGLLF